MLNPSSAYTVKYFYTLYLVLNLVVSVANQFKQNKRLGWLGWYPKSFNPWHYKPNNDYKMFVITFVHVNPSLEMDHLIKYIGE
jgi:hypothetical protein